MVTHAGDADDSRPKAGFIECFPCGTTPRNVCRGELAALGLGSHFERVKVAWNRYIDSLSKASVRDAQVVFMLRSQSPEGRPVLAWYMIAKVMGSPKIQVLLRCWPSDVAGLEDRFYSREMDPPYTLAIQTRRSRLGTDHDFMSPFHETSEEVIFAMLQRSTAEWSIVPLMWQFPDNASSLLDMRVIAHRDAVPLVGRETTSTCVVDALAEMKTGSARALAASQGGRICRGQAKDGAPASSRWKLCRPLCDDLDGVVMSDEEDIDTTEPVAGEVQRWLDTDFSDQDMFDLAGQLADVIDEQMYGLEQSVEGEVEEMLGEHLGVGSDAEPGVGAGVYVEGGSSSSTDPSTAAGHVGVAPECIEAAVEAEEAASDAAAHPEGTEFSLGGSLALRPSGSVVCSLHPFEGLSLGTVGRHHFRPKMYVNCHLHPHCDIHVGVAREEVSRMKMAQWLATGYPCKGLPAEERRRLGAQHRAQWSRHGPLGRVGPLGNLDTLGADA